MRIFLFVTLLLAFYFVKSQSALTSYSCTLFGTSTKFSNRSALEIDKFNNKWIGFSNTDTTYKSLIKYDGTWTDYSSSIHDAVLSLSSDNAGTIWIGTKTKGLCKFDGSNFIFYDTLNSNIPSNQVNALLFTNNIIYIGTTKGLSEFDGSTFNNLNTTNSAIMCDTITCLESDPSGNIWIGTYTGLHKMDPSNNFDTPYQTFTPITDLAFDSPHNSIGILYNSNLRNLDMQYLPVPQQDSNFCINCLNPANPVIGIGRDSDGNILYSRGAGPLVEPLTNPLILYSAGTLAFKFKCDTSGILYYIRNGPATKLFLYSFNDSLYVESTANSFIYETKLNSKTLRANKVRVLCTAGGDQGYNNMPGYEVPVLSNKFTTFTSALWLGGYSSGQLRTSAATYRQNGLDFWPGPINSANGTV